MAFSLWKSEKEDLQAEKIKQLEEMVSTLELKINDYESALSKVQVHNNENHNDSQIADIYTRIQNIYDNEESNLNRIHQLEREIYSYKEILNMNENDIKALTSKVQQLQQEQELQKRQEQNSNSNERKGNDVPLKEQNYLKSNRKKKRNVEFANKNQSLFLYGNTFGETIQRISPSEKSAKKNEKNQRVKKKQKNELISGSEYLNRYYPKGEIPNHVTSFNPTKYS